jgi:hypothetical protein
VAITCLTTLDPGDRYGHRQLTMPIEVVLDAWMTRYGSTPQPVRRIVFEDGSADELLNNMCVIVYRMCRRNINRDLFEYLTQEHRVYAMFDIANDNVMVRVDLMSEYD